MTDKTYGKFGVPVGEKCGSLTEVYTCPGCYNEFEDEDTTECPVCHAPVWCYAEYAEKVTNYYCEIRDPEDWGQEDD